jgi:hypothetical protein
VFSPAAVDDGFQFLELAGGGFDGALAAEGGVIELELEFGVIAQQIAEHEESAVIGGVDLRGGD